MVIWIASFPRSGNSFFRTILHHYYGIPTHAIYVDRDKKLHDLMGVTRLPKEDLSNPDNTYWVKTHKTNTIRLHKGKTSAIYIVRDGRDAYVSYAEHKGRDINKLITQGRRDSWGEHVQSWLKKPNIHIVKFEDLIANPKEELQKAVEFGQPDLKMITDEDPPSFEQLHEAAPLFFRRGVVGSWKDEMSPETAELFWKQPSHAKAMKDLGYE